MNGLSKEGGLTKVELTKKIGAVLEGKIREALSRRGGLRGGVCGWRGLTRNLKHNAEGTY